MSVAGLGSLWMLYTAIRHEKHPLGCTLLAMTFPYMFVWYYFERVRPRKQFGDFSAAQA